MTQDRHATWLIAATAILVNACQQPAQSVRPPAAPSFRQQVADVRAGTTNEIIVVAEVVEDDELALLSGLTSLEKLEVHKLQATAVGLEHLSTIGLQHVVLRGEGLDDDGMEALSRCPNLRVINLPTGTFSDKGLARLKGLKNLELLRFSSSNVTDEGMKHIAEIDSIRFLHFVAVPITDAGAQHLESMKQLESFYIDDSQVTDTAIERLWKAIPGLHIHINQRHSDRDPHRHSHD